MKFKIEAYDLSNNVYIIHKKWFGFLWLPFPKAGAGTRKKMLDIRDDLEAINILLKLKK